MEGSFGWKNNKKTPKSSKFDAKNRFEAPKIANFSSKSQKFAKNRLLLAACVILEPYVNGESDIELEKKPSFSWRKIHAKFSGEPRDAREKSCIRPPNAKFLIEIGMKLQGEIMANFQILVPKSNFPFVIFKSTSKLQIECQKLSLPIPLESRFET